MNYTRPPLAILIEPIKKAFLDAKSRDVKLRYLTEINNSNNSYCKELMGIVNELRHLDGIKANSMISEAQYLAPLILYEEGKIASQIIYSDVKEIVEQGQYIFDTLWDRAIPAEQKINEIEEGIEPEFLEVITDHKKASQIVIDLAKSAKTEVLLLLPNDKGMIRMDKLGVIDYLIKASSQNGASIKIICPLSEENSDSVKRISQKAPNISILNGSNCSSGMFIVDNTKFIKIETRKPNAEIFSEAMGFTIYSNSRLSVDSLKSFFELLWNERNLNEELKRADNMQKEFINIAAHELRNPIQPILGLSEVLYTKIKDTEQRQLLDAITRNAKRLQQLTEDILDVSKIESQSLKLKKEQFNLNDIISNAVQDYTKQIEKRSSNRSNSNVKIFYKPTTDDMLVVEADKARLAQVISNLLSNAVKFTKEETIFISTEKKDNHILVSVKDTGTGIDPKILPRLFSKFVTKSDKGTGIGLFICKSIVEAHGGKIWAENHSNGKGATFSFSLPIK
jgi:two-component system, OmpR family, sensor histidine kinase VicK